MIAIPLYGFLCPVCGPFDEWRPMAGRAAVAHCPRCGAEAVRTMAAPAVLRGGRSRPDRSLPRVETRAPAPPAGGLQRSAGRPWQCGH